MYQLFKFVHVAAAIAWLGAGLAFQVMNARVAATRDPTAIGVMSEQGEWFGKMYFSVASVVTLVAGVAMVLVSDGIGFGDAWITIGFLGIAASIVTGAVLIGRTTNELNTVVDGDGPDSPRVAALQRRLATLGVVDLVILFTVVAVMVWKPGA